MFFLKRVKVALFVFVLCVLCSCAAVTRQGGLIETYDRLTLTYDMTARTLARTCVYHNVPKETCDKWGSMVNRANVLLRQMGEIIDQVLLLSANPEADPYCKQLLDNCPPNDLQCRYEARNLCFEKYYSQYYALQRQVGRLLRELSRALLKESKGGTSNG